MSQMDTRNTPVGDPEFWDGLTMWGLFGSAQVREVSNLDGDSQPQLVLYVKPDAERSAEDGHPYVIGAYDMRRVRDLLNIATARGML